MILDLLVGLVVNGVMSV